MIVSFSLLPMCHYFESDICSRNMNNLFIVTNFHCFTLKDFAKPLTQCLDQAGQEVMVNCCFAETISYLILEHYQEVLSLQLLRAMLISFNDFNSFHLKMTPLAICLMYLFSKCFLSDQYSHQSHLYPDSPLSLQSTFEINCCDKILYTFLILKT